MTQCIGPLPGWVVPAEQQVRDCWWNAHQVATVAAEDSALGVFVALDWVLRPAERQTPVTVRSVPPSWQFVRGESWAALSVAAGRPEPTGRDWRRLEALQGPTRATHRVQCCGVWQGLSWLLGVRAEPPIGIPDRDESGAVVPGSEVYCLPVDRSRPALLAAKRSREERELDESVRHWEHIRTLADREKPAV